MICSFLAGRPAGRDGANAAGAARFCEWVFVMGDPTHARFCGVSLLAAAKLQQLLHLSFCPYFFGVTLPRAGAYTEQKDEGTRAL